MPEVEQRSKTTFADVGGLEDVKQRLNRSFLLPLKQPEVFARFGKSVRGGLLLYGPPGCGKTFIARALAGEIGARFVSIGLSDVLDMWLGESERKLHELFENARRDGRHRLRQPRSLRPWRHQSPLGRGSGTAADKTLHGHHGNIRSLFTVIENLMPALSKRQIGFRAHGERKKLPPAEP